MWAVTSPWPQKLVCRSQIYSTALKLMLISDQARDCYEGRPLCDPQNGSSTSGILSKSAMSGKFTCYDLCGESELLRVRERERERE